MKIYFYSPSTSEYIGEGLADQSPLENGVWLLPAYSTSIAVPEIPEGKAAVFKEEGWQVYEDFRGKTYWLPDGTSKIVKSLFEEIPEDASFDQPEKTLAELKSDRSKEIRALCGQKIILGFESNALGSIHSYPSDLEDQANLSGSVLSSVLPNLAPDWTTSFLCKDSENVWGFRLHSASQIQKVGTDGKDFILQLRLKHAGLQQLITAADTKEKVEAITWDSI